MEDLLDLLEELSSCPGPPGGEEPVAHNIRRHLESNCEIQRDGLGSLIAVKKGSRKQPRIMLSAHMDEVGFMLQNVTKEGYLRLQPLGGWIASHLPGQRLNVHGSKGTVEGIVAAVPPHFKKDQKTELKVEDLLVDVGASSREAVTSLGLQLGDLITPVSHFAVYNEKLLANKAWDNRVGCAVMVAAMKQLRTHPNTVVAAATVQEEVGSRGAVTAAEVVRPQAAVVLEGAPADDLPGIARDEPQGALGRGCQIRLYDPSTIIHRRFWKWVTELARKHSIAHQLAVRQSGATDARAIHLAQGGVPTVVLAAPVRYAHGHSGLVHMGDVQAALALTMAILERLDRKILGTLMPT
ncbi:MAG: M20/M25/M40 family metallo-hydrolase [Deltaproteobacteria bacterium]|nr:MAG: M20/M25/M40 family metallo-hydrolase [Deltaproteobacteria bacterium]